MKRYKDQWEQAQLLFMYVCEGYTKYLEQGTVYASPNQNDNDLWLTIYTIDMHHQ